jgi:hypothetical protein
MSQRHQLHLSAKLHICSASLHHKSAVKNFVSYLRIASNFILQAQKLHNEWPKS